MSVKKKIFNILLLLAIAIVFFKIATFVVYSYAYPPNHIEQKSIHPVKP